MLALTHNPNSHKMKRHTLIIINLIPSITLTLTIPSHLLKLQIPPRMQMTRQEKHPDKPNMHIRQLPRQYQPVAFEMVLLVREHGRRPVARARFGWCRCMFSCWAGWEDEAVIYGFDMEGAVKWGHFVRTSMKEKQTFLFNGTRTLWTRKWADGWVDDWRNRGLFIYTPYSQFISLYTPLNLCDVYNLISPAVQLVMMTLT